MEQPIWTAIPASGEGKTPPAGTARRRTARARAGGRVAAPPTVRRSYWRRRRAPASSRPSGSSWIRRGS